MVVIKDPTKKIPQITGLPILGNLGSLFSSPQLYLWKAYLRYGPVFKIKIGMINIAILVGPEANQFVLKDNASSFSAKKGYWFLQSVLGNGILLQDGLEHNRTRKILLPAFHSQIVERYFNIILQEAEQFFDSWQTDIEIAFAKELHRLTFRIVCRLLFDEQRNEITSELYQLFSTYVRAAASPSSLLKLKIGNTKYGRSCAARLKLETYLQRVIQQKRMQGFEQGEDMLSLLLKSNDEMGHSLSDAQIGVEILQLLFAARDTTAHQLSWLLFELGRQPVWAERLRNEINQVVGNQMLQLNHLKQLLNMGYVLKEIERIYPPAYVLPRGVIEKVQFAGYGIPVGWTVNVSPFLTHRMPEIYLHPDSFDPMRFAPPREEHKIHPFALIGFGGGEHRCLGYELAQMELKIVLTLLLQRFRWRATPSAFDLEPCFQTFEVLPSLRARVEIG